MKKSILMWAIMLTMGLSSAFANNEETINQRAVNSFKKDFTSAQDVRWENNKDFVKATFKLNDQVMFAYYSQTGDLMAITRNIVSSQLPIGLLSNLKKSYGTYWISDLFEISTSTDASYYVTLQNSDHTVVLKSNGIGWEVYKKDKKNI
ncbi:MAG: hypothetical protein H7122_01935 [Chitinophagaceae bacterium]|nr:hypothetical protein [Chitinophagaceae bacterium]